MTSYHIFDAIAAIPELREASGVRMMPSDFFFPMTVETDAEQYAKMEEIRNSGVRGFQRGAHLIEEHGCDPSYGAVDAYELLSPIIDTDKAMVWLTQLVASKGATYITETLSCDLLFAEDSLRARFKADAIVNCTGIAAEGLAGDKSVYPIRGGLIRVINDGVDFPKLEAALIITQDVDPDEIVFLVPRNDNILLIGGIAELRKATLDLSLDTPVIQRMRKRCEAFLPGLKNARLDPDYPFAQGLRPFRGQNVRNERELRRSGSRIVHSYGHGGAGWSLSFGCASDVVLLVEEVLAGVPARSMADRLEAPKDAEYREIRALL
jgi:hypothetical protein